MNFSEEKIRKRFCKDTGIPIGVFRSPYFESRLDLCESLYGSKSKWERFKESCLENGYNNDSFYQAFTDISNNVIEFIKSKAGYAKFNELQERKEYPPIINDPNYKPRSSNIYKQENDGKIFISIDMSKANFTTLRAYDYTIFDDSRYITYEEFISKFTNNEYFISSKYIRQVIFGNLNPKRISSYEKYYMSQLLAKLIEIADYSNDKFVIEAFTEDEIVIKPELENWDNVINIIKDFESYVTLHTSIDIKVSVFRLSKIDGCEGYIKYYLHRNFESTGEVDIKCVGNLYIPFVIRAINKEEIKDEDRYFVYEGKLAKLVDVPNILSL